MFWIQLVVVTGVILVIAAVVLGAGGSLPDAYREQPELRMPGDRPLTSADVDHIRFPVVFRGYRMSEVDLVLDRLTGELAARDARILELEYQVAGTTPVGVGSPPPAGAVAGASALGTNRHTPPPRGSGTTLSLEKPDRPDAIARPAMVTEAAEAVEVAEVEVAEVAEAAEPGVDADERPEPAAGDDEAKGDPKS